MNRRKKFYSTLNYNYDDDDDYYDDEYEDDYYDEENEDNHYYYDDDETKDQQPVVQSCDGTSLQPLQISTTKDPSISQATLPVEGNASLGKDPSICPEDIDYSLLITLLPVFQTKWTELATTQEPKTELAQRDVVKALRDCNYDVDEAVVFALQNVADKQFNKELQKPSLSSPPTSPANDIALKVTTGSALATGRAPVPGGRKLNLGQGNKNIVAPATKDIQTELESTSATTNSASVTCKKPSQKKGSVLEAMPDTSKKDCTFLIAGHVDAGKSTTLGHLLLLLGKVSQTEVDNNEKNARSLHKESFKYAWLLDQSEEERRRGVTIDTGSYCFETEHRRIHILDAPGHKDYLLSMISGATQADAALLVVTAAMSEFDVGLAYGTRDHLLVLKILGVRHIVVAVNKMDAVDFSQKRYDYVVQNLGVLLKQLGYKEKDIVGFCPISGIQGKNIFKVDPSVVPWYSGPSLIELLDQCPVKDQFLDAPLRLSLQDVQGSRLYCKVESGRLQKASRLFFLPSDVEVDVKSVFKPTTGGLVDVAFAGDSVEIDARVTPVGLLPGYIGCLSASMIRCSTDFEARVQTLTTLEKSILPGATFTMVVHALTVPVEVVALVSKMDGQGNWSKGMVKCVPKATHALIAFRADYKIALEPAEVCRSLGCFVLLQNGTVVAGGLVMKMIL